MALLIPGVGLVDASTTLLIPGAGLVESGAASQSLTQSSTFTNSNALAYAHTLSVGAVTLTPSLFSNSNSLAFAHQANLGLTAAVFANEQSFYAHALTYAQALTQDSAFANSNTLTYQHTLARDGDVTDQPSGGWAAYNAYDAERQRRRRKRLEEEEDEREALADRLEAQLAAEGLIEADPAVAQRIVVREYAQSPELLNRRAQRAVDYALRAKTELAWQLAAREIARQEEDEELAVLLLLAAA